LRRRHFFWTFSQAALRWDSRLRRLLIETLLAYFLILSATFSRQGLRQALLPTQVAFGNP
jgi:hypothetical protein